MVSPIWDNIFRRDKDQTTVNYLAATPFFQKLTPRELRFLENIVHLRQYRSGEPVFTAGETGVGMFLITAGSVQITDETNHQVELGPGDFFGELALVEKDSRRNVTAAAAVDTQLIGFFKPDLEEIIERNPAIGAKILKGLAQVITLRLRECNRQRLSEK